MIAVVGAGRWGQNLIRNFYALGVLSIVCDSDNNKLNQLHHDSEYGNTQSCF